MKAYQDPETGKAFYRIKGNEVHYKATARTSHLDHSWWQRAFRKPVHGATTIVFVVPAQNVNRFVIVFNVGPGAYLFWVRLNEKFAVWQHIEWVGTMTYQEAEEHVNCFFIEAARNDARSRYNAEFE